MSVMINTITPFLVEKNEGLVEEVPHGPYHEH